MPTIWNVRGLTLMLSCEGSCEAVSAEHGERAVDVDLVLLNRHIRAAAR